MTGLVPVSGASTWAIRLAALALALSDRALARFCSARSSSLARLAASAKQIRIGGPQLGEASQSGGRLALLVFQHIQAIGVKGQFRF